MSTLSQLQAQERACLSRIRELGQKLDYLSEFSREISRSCSNFQDQLAGKVTTARRAGDLAGTRMAQRYAEHTVGYLNGEFSRSMLDEFEGLSSNVDTVTRHTEQELEEEKARLSSIRASIEAERARERAEEARRQAEEARRKAKAQAQRQASQR